MAPTHYDVLGVSRSATLEQVRAAYRASARDHHPDAGGDPARMQAVNAAWRVLGDPRRRAAYDREIDRRSAPDLTARGTAPPGHPGAPRTGDGWVPGGEWTPDLDGRDLSADEWADLADGRPIGETKALRGWWAILPPGMVVAAAVLLFGAAWFTSPVLYAGAGGALIMAAGLFVLAPLRAMAKRKDG